MGELTPHKDAPPPAPIEAPKPAPMWYEGVPRSARGPTLFGFAVLAIGVFGFGGWAATAPIDGAVVSPGVFVATSQNKIVQHLEGGIIHELLVTEGERVEAGDPLLRLDETQARADLRRLRLREAQLEATAARLDAEADRATEVSFPVHLTRARTQPEIAAALDSQNAIFEARRERLLTEIAIQERAITSFEHRNEGDEARLEGSRIQYEIIGEELAAKKQLYDQGLARSAEYFALRRAHADMAGEIGLLESRIEDNLQRKEASRDEIERTLRGVVQQAVEARQEIAGELKDIRERITAQEAVLDRIEVLAPVDGIVVKMNYHTPGGVIRPGADIMELLPTSDDLVIEARIRPQDIDSLHDGQEASVKLTAFNQRVVPNLTGQVIYVSADAVPDDQPGAPRDNVYIVRVGLNEGEVDKLQGAMMTPGMPAEVYITTASRTFLEYLMKPVFDSMQRAFRET